MDKVFFLYPLTRFSSLWSLVIFFLGGSTWPLFGHKFWSGIISASVSLLKNIWNAFSGQFLLAAITSIVRRGCNAFNHALTFNNVLKRHTNVLLFEVKLNQNSCLWGKVAIRVGWLGWQTLSSFAAQPTPKKKLTKKTSRQWALFFLYRIPHSRSFTLVCVALKKVVESKIQNSLFQFGSEWNGLRKDQMSGRHALPLHVIHEVREHHFEKLTSRPHQSFVTLSSPMLHLRRVACRVRTSVFG